MEEIEQTKKEEEKQRSIAVVIEYLGFKYLFKLVVKLTTVIWRKWK